MFETFWTRYQAMTLDERDQLTTARRDDRHKRPYWKRRA
jgi:hypothetical protein